MYFKTTKDNNYFNNNYVIYNYNYVIVIAHKCPYLQCLPQSVHQGRMTIDLKFQHLEPSSWWGQVAGMFQCPRWLQWRFVPNPQRYLYTEICNKAISTSSRIDSRLATRCNYTPGSRTGWANSSFRVRARTNVLTFECSFECRIKCSQVLLCVRQWSISDWHIPPYTNLQRTCLVQRCYQCR